MTSVPQNEFRKRKIAALEKSLAALGDDYAALQEALYKPHAPVDGARYRRELEEIETRVVGIEAELDGLYIHQSSAQTTEATPFSVDIERKICNIDFETVNDTVAALTPRWANGRGAVLFAIERGKQFGGRGCVERIRGLLQSSWEQYVTPVYYRVDFNGTGMDVPAVLDNLARQLDAPPPDNHKDVRAYTALLRRSLIGMLHDDLAVVIEFFPIDKDEVTNRRLLRWFLEDFWHPLVAEQANANNHTRSALIAILHAQDKIKSTAIPANQRCYCITGHTNVVQANGDGSIIFLALEKWKEEHLHKWFLTTVRISPEHARQRTEEAYAGSDGIPATIISVLLSSEFQTKLHGHWQEAQQGVRQ